MSDDRYGWISDANAEGYPDEGPNPLTKTTLSLTEFLLARIAEDEAGARRLIDKLGGVADSMLRTWDLSAECAAKRTIVEQAEGLLYVAPAGDTILRALASVYADHPDYNPDWSA